MKAKEILKLLPNDDEVAKWFSDNIDESTATASSSIYKFRMYLQDKFEKELEPTKHNLGGFLYITEK